MVISLIFVKMWCSICAIVMEWKSFPQGDWHKHLLATSRIATSSNNCRNYSSHGLRLFSLITCLYMSIFMAVEEELFSLPEMDRHHIYLLRSRHFADSVVRCPSRLCIW